MMSYKILFFQIGLLVTINSGVKVNFVEPQEKQGYYFVSDREEGRDIYEAQLGAGKSVVNLTAPDLGAHKAHNINPMLSPDGTKIVYQCDHQIHDRYTIWVLDLKTKKRIQITKDEGMYPSWSHDGKEIYFSGRRNGVWEVLRVSAHGGEEKLISKNRLDGKNPGWGASVSASPDGKYLLLAYIRERKLYRLDLNSNETILLDAEAAFMHPRYSHKGDKIAVNKRGENGYDMVCLDQDGNYVETFAKSVVSYSPPAWSKDDSSILFSGSVNKHQQIFLLNLKTGKETQLTNNNDLDLNPAW